MTPAHARPIRIALLGVDDATGDLLRAILASERFELAGGCELDSGLEPYSAGTVLSLVGHLRQFQGWESLLDRELVDAVVVARGRDDDRRAEQLRKLFQTGISVLASHPVVDSMLVYYELDMIRRDTQCVVVPYLPERRHPAVLALGEMAGQGAGASIGKVEQVAMERQVDRPDKTVVLAHFARDADVIRSITGDMTRLGAMAGLHDSVNYSGLSVQMSGPAGVVARWSVDPQRGPRGRRLTMLASHGKAVVEMPESGRPWSLHVTAGDDTDTQTYDNWSPAATMLDELARAIDGQSPGNDWVDAARDVELAETIARSLTKGRTIELYYEDYTEQGTFKGLMASVGCGLLILGCLIPAVVGIADQVGLPYVNKWPYALAGGLGIFLLLQLLMLVFRSKEPQAQDVVGPGVTMPPK